MVGVTVVEVVELAGGFVVVEVALLALLTLGPPQAAATRASAETAAAARRSTRLFAVTYPSLMGPTTILSG